MQREAGKVKNRKEEKLKSDTNAFLKKRKDMRRVTTRGKIEYAELCQTIRTKIRPGLRNANTKKIKKAIEVAKV